MASHTYKIKGMHCASCASIIEREFKKTEGVKSVEVNYGTESANIEYDEKKLNEDKLSEKIKPLGYEFLSDHKGMEHGGMGKGGEHDHMMNMAKDEKMKELKDLKNKLIAGIPLTIISVIFMTWEILAVQAKVITEMPEIVKTFMHHLMPVIATYVLFVIGRQFLQGVWRFMRFGKANMDTLVGIGTLTAFLYSFFVSAFENVLKPYLNTEIAYYDVTIVVIVFITLGKYLEARSKIKTGDAIEKLLELQAKTALVIRDGKEVEIPIENVVHGDKIIVKPGGKIPVDGTVIDGKSNVDESMMTGEPVPVSKIIGDKLVAGTINKNGVLTFKATGVGSETLLAHIIKMVETAQGSKAPIQKLADQISAVFVPIVLVISVVALILWLVVGSQFSQALTFGLICFVGVLVIACPCALGLATPTAIIVGVGKGASNGMLIKNAEILEKLHKVDTIVVDKTGTITKGKPEIIKMINLSKENDKKILEVLASLEKSSGHPLADAITDEAKKKGVTIHKISDFENIEGKGIKGKLSGKEYFAGSKKLLLDMKIKYDEKSYKDLEKLGATIIALFDNKVLLALLAVGDSLKDEAKQAIKELHKMGVKIIMATGDHKDAAEKIAKEAGIDEFIAEVMPQDKLDKIVDLQKQGHIVAMAGDGVNDAPALAKADVGIAMGNGTDVAIESSDVTILNGDISKLAKTIKLSKITMRTIKQNLFWAFIYNIIGIPIASGALYPMFGLLLNPVFAGLAMAFSSVSVVTNSLRLKFKKL